MEVSPINAVQPDARHYTPCCLAALIRVEHGVGLRNGLATACSCCQERLKTARSMSLISAISGDLMSREARK